MKKPFYKQIPIKGVIASLAVAGMLVTVGRSVIAQPSTVPRPRDAARSTRELAPPGQTLDTQVAPPPTAGRWIAGNGIIEPAAPETRVAGAIAGRIARILVAEGAQVTAGQPLVELDAATERAALEAAEAEVTVARAELTRAMHGSRREDIEAATADTAGAQRRAELTQSLLSRTEGLFRSGNATQDELDRARAQADIDRASARQLDARRRATVAGTRREEITVAVARLRSAEARRAQSQATLERLTVTAPLDGEVLQVKFRVGEYYAPAGEPLMVIGDTRTYRARIDIDEREFAQVSVGANAYVVADAYGERRFGARVTHVARRFGRRNLRTDDPSERIDTKILEVVLTLQNANGLLVGQRVVGYLQTVSGSGNAQP
ncbi:MAG: efflux RND transporter periplasmic adaptor subunit [Deltaproteobacteria bacterium]|nr:efflux RND transporter periplasmic adaptor subunit [Deltaproteobacteria bacterium]